MRIAATVSRRCTTLDLPFTEAAFLEVFRRYNEGVWPLHLAFYGPSILLIFLARRGSARPSLWIAGMLALLWGWMGAVYHWGYFAAINPAARDDHASRSSELVRGEDPRDEGKGRSGDHGEHRPHHLDGRDVHLRHL